MPTKNEVFPSKYLKAEGLKGRPVVVKIAKSAYEKLKNPSGVEQMKVVLSFHKSEKLLPLNVTNFDSVMDITGEDNSDNWVGHKVELFSAHTEMQGKTVNCIRIRKPPSSQDELPIPAGAPAPDPKPVVAADPDTDDEIPF